MFVDTCCRFQIILVMNNKSESIVHWDLKFVDYTDDKCLINKIKKFTVTYLPVKPISLVNPLSQNLNGRLGTILLLGRHVQIINKDNQTLSWGWTIHSFLTPRK